jgi:hypothetical protein
MLRVIMVLIIAFTCWIWRVCFLLNSRRELTELVTMFGSSCFVVRLCAAMVFHFQVMRSAPWGAANAKVNNREVRLATEWLHDVFGAEMRRPG